MSTKINSLGPNSFCSRKIHWPKWQNWIYGCHKISRNSFCRFRKCFRFFRMPFILKALEAFNFGQNFIKWFSVLYNNVQSSVINGGFMTNYVKITRGVRQGCPLSPSLFILAVEILALNIRQSPNCKLKAYIYQMIKKLEYPNLQTIALL